MSDSAMLKSEPILVWGIAGASLGMEIAKCLRLAGFRNIVGCDISPAAFGHFSDIFSKTFVIDRLNPGESLVRLLECCRPRFVLAGGDQVARILSSFADLFSEHHCQICGNSNAVTQLSSDKYRVIVRLQEAGFEVPLTHLVDDNLSVSVISLPAVFKPRFDSGGSRGVYVVCSQDEIESRVTSVMASSIPYVVQEYLPESHGEYTVGVLSETGGRVSGSILLRRTFQSMLSVHERANQFLISSGSSQGYFEHNATLQAEAEAIATAVGSTGPLNIQARVRNGKLATFEINARFSASTYLRALSGVNEVSLYIKHLFDDANIDYPRWIEGLALRSFSEVFVEKKDLGNHVL